MNTLKINIKISAFLLVVFSLGVLSGFSIKNNQKGEQNMLTNEHSSHSVSTVAEPEEKIHNHSAENHLHLSKNSPEPTVSIAATKDTMGGFNIHVKTTDFLWTPEKAGGKVEEAAGHAHVYVNDIKVGRLYGPWMYIPEKYFTTGSNKIKVTLNANNHMDWYNNEDTKQIIGETIVVVENK